ncbi:GLPGLI family protein [Antarcticibacterium flavum]|uniref:GLPGLI family protein n=1 Tax=Antarcticibacterium flavum TaxID=2058175 RepID=A0A5B7X7Q2_9FLAO|nr:GLPGLI family protein [Antarcticibacterium flavum]QCY71120.1 GLPGLI family protein [Antarcticibacterium flavum]
MYKNRLSLILLIIFQTAFSQNSVTNAFKYKATYELTSQIDSTNPGSIERETMVLYIGDRISRFSSRDRLEGDEVLKKQQKDPNAFTGNNQGSSKRSLGYYIYKGIPEGKLSFTQKIVLDNYQYVEDLKQFEWEILPETKEITGYKVQKATTRFAGRDYIAWFTPEIPISDGPYKFNGLPGLILEIQDTRGHYSFILENFEILKERALLEFDPRDYIQTSRKNFLRVLEKFNRDPETALEQVGSPLLLGPDKKKKWRESIRRN